MLLIVRERMSLRAVWRWAVIEVLPVFVVLSVVVAVICLISHRFIGYWAELPIYYVVFAAGFALIRHLWTRRAVRTGRRG
jgi:hypothetical protein